MTCISHTKPIREGTLWQLEWQNDNLITFTAFWVATATAYVHVDCTAYVTVCMPHKNIVTTLAGEHKKDGRSGFCSVESLSLKLCTHSRIANWSVMCL